jgi:hypothetical protein
LTHRLRQIRDTRQFKAWLKARETLEFRVPHSAIGHIVPEEAQASPAESLDAAARRKRIFGDRVFETNAVLEAREDSRY